ncbi:PqqD family protein [Gemelliphila palaticanis]|uniref:PqqD family protein n=1 Tax=Gemelliphila palaticanis TaxID=81950 RepID=A0ABX2T0C0_9BACL|nr:PqqD family protein [Gemella palaticanis]MBF0716166.1 PqqD family protein [Gemella palaticanis]NYS48096.1 PqqD family protein [Gemella palaticanis]
MRLHPDYVTHLTGEEQVIVATGDSAAKFCGIVRGNETMALIVEYFKEDVTKEFVVDDILSKYDIDRETVEEDVDKVINTLKNIGALINE